MNTTYALFFSSLQIFECFFSLYKLCSSLVPLRPISVSLSLKCFMLFPYTSLSLRQLAFLSLWTPSPSRCLFRSRRSPVWLMPPFIFRRIREEYETRGEYTNSVCTCGWVTAEEEDWWSLTSSVCWLVCTQPVILLAITSSLTFK